MSPTIIAGAVQGLAGVASGIIGYKQRRAEQRAAQQEFDAAKAQYMNQDLTNPYANMENTMEDLTVNQQAAQFQAAQGAQGLANTMTAMRGAAGGSGIAALAQSLANAQQQNALQSSASIAQQEAGNTAAAAQEAGRIQLYERKGDMLSREMKRNQYSTELGMSQGRLAEANFAQQQATQAIVGGVGNLVTGGVGLGNYMSDGDNKWLAALTSGGQQTEE